MSGTGSRIPEIQMYNSGYITCEIVYKDKELEYSKQLFHKVGNF